MSHIVQVNYGHISCQCNSICEIAKNTLQQLDDMLENLNNTSTSIINEQSQALKKEIQKERKNLLNKINNLVDSSNILAKKGIVSLDNDSYEYKARNKIIEDAKSLQDLSDELSSKRIIEFQGLLQNLLKISLHDNYEKKLAGATGKIFVTTEIQKLLDSISDSVLKQYVYLAYMQDNTLSVDELMDKANGMINMTFEENYQLELEKIKRELELARVDKNVINKVITQEGNNAQEKLSKVRQEASEEIVGEKLRQQSLKIIKDNIRKRGFIVDKKNIKINREKNEVIMVALKASGEKATFKVYMDGKFIYDFHGYEGQACQKDIKPFMNDLEQVYGIHIDKTQEIWSNPDKISTMKFQSFNTNKNRR